ncbi:MAG: SDR family oxidoreductase [Ectothiorhodospiraceae bacterium]|nr:SDR family oxidoreductase [Ectothiorhodospiraceae bacterium]
MRALVTGAASGIGRATCLRLARDGAANGTPAQIAAVDLAATPALDAVVAEVAALGGKAFAVAADMGSADGPGKAVGAAVTRLGGLDAVVSNAGINRPGKMLDYTVEDWDQVFAVNTRATWLLAKAAHPALADGGGAIVAVSSMSGNFAHAGLGAYGPSKAAVSMTVRVLAQEFAPDGIRVNAVSPGMVQTGMTVNVYANNEVASARAGLVPLGRVAQPEDMADVIVFLLGHDARYVNGQDIIVDGGFTGNHLGRIPGLTSITRS